MWTRKTTILATCALVVALGGCGRDIPQSTSSVPAPKQSARRAPASPAASASAYLTAAAAIDLFEIRSSELALQRSSSPRVREFATMMIQAHRGTSAQLSLAGRRLNLLPSAILPPRQQALLDRLAASPNFDATYKMQQLAVHGEALALHRNYAARGGSPTLRPVAAASVPIIERHLRTIRYL